MCSLLPHTIDTIDLGLSHRWTLYFIGESIPYSPVDDMVLMRKAYDWVALKSDLFSVQWLPSMQVMATDMKLIRDRTLFVVQTFDGEVYECLCRRKAKVIGPLLIMYSTPSMITRFMAHTSCPIFSGCMSGCVVAISLVDKHLKHELIVKIRSMSGDYSRDITPTVTHLIANTNQSGKYRRAMSYDIDVVSEEWVLQCWHTFQYDLLKANHSRVVNQFLIAEPTPPLMTHYMTDYNEESVPIKMEDNTADDDGMQWIDGSNKKKTESEVPKTNFRDNSSKITDISGPKPKKLKTLENHMSLGDVINEQPFVCWDYTSYSQWSKTLPQSMSSQRSCHKSLMT